jgi:sulfite oxidase
LRCSAKRFGIPVATKPARRLSHDAEGLNTGTWPIPPDQFITPAAEFFTRSHASVPAINPSSWRLEVGGLVRRSLSFTLADLEQFPRHEVTATLLCAGLRRNELSSLAPLPGELPWGAEPAGTARWSGYRLGDILAAAGVTGQAKYVELLGLDEVERHGQRFGFGGSIDLSKALGAEVLLATELNGTRLSPAHGFPLRALVPGWIGARSVKWLGRISLLEEPSTNYFQSQAYRVQREPNPEDPRDVSAGIALTRVLVNSVILKPTQGDIIRPGPLRVHGWAIGTDGKALRKVELSADGDGDWILAEMRDHTEWSWTLWQAEMRLKPGSHTLMVRATDVGGDTQPEAIDATWNVKGYANNAWHRVAIGVS